MAVTEVDLDREGRTAEVDERYRRTYRRRWRVTSNNASDNEATILNQIYTVGPTPVPPLWTPHPADGFAFLHNIRLFQESRDDPKLWIAEGDYRVLDPNEEQEDNNQNPLARPTKYRLEGETYTEVIDNDKDGVKIVNSAKQPFDEPIERESTRLILVAEKNYATLQAIIDLNISYATKVNSDTYRGAGARSWLCKFIECSEKKTENGIEYYTAVFRLAYNADTWRLFKLDRGTKHYKAANDLALICAKDTDGCAFNEPVPLAVDGTRLPDALPPLELEFDVYDEVAFSGLGV